MALQRFFRRFECADCERLYRVESGRSGFTCVKCEKECVGIGGYRMAVRWRRLWGSGYIAWQKGADGKLVKIGRPLGMVAAKKKKT